MVLQAWANSQASENVATRNTVLSLPERLFKLGQSRLAPRPPLHFSHHATPDLDETLQDIVAQTKLVVPAFMRR